MENYIKKSVPLSEMWEKKGKKRKKDQRCVRRETLGRLQKYRKQTFYEKEIIFTTC